ncbi:MAG: hypothetical protein E7448_03260 [Ruminococcaceae bacterium]|nr:hypothetical protein [Oscillospiraceae bacterium]
MHENYAEYVYYTLIGAYIPGCGAPGIENAFADGEPCSELYNNAYDAYQRICDRLGVEDEDDDVEIIFQSLLMISQTLGLKMFHYGQKDIR